MDALDWLRIFLISIIVIGALVLLYRQWDDCELEPCVCPIELGQYIMGLRCPYHG